MDEVMRNLAPPLGLGVIMLVTWIWARGAHRRARERAGREAHPPK